MQNFICEVKAKFGIHAIPAGRLVMEARKYDSKITLIKGEKKADLRKMVEIRKLGVKCGDKVEVQVEGSDEVIATRVLKAFFERNL